MRRYILALLIFAAFYLSLPLSANASAAHDAAWNAAYEAVMKNPTDYKLNQRYFDLCVEREDYEAAISPLERMLAKNPADASIMFQLGQMYQKLRSQKVAHTYFKKVAANANASPELRAQASSLIQSQE